MKMARILLTLIALGAVLAGGLSQGEQPAEGSEPRRRGAELPKNPSDAGKPAASQRESEEGAPPNKIAGKREVHPGQARLKPTAPIPRHAEQQKRHDEHAPTFCAPGSGIVIPPQPKTALQPAKPAFETRKTDGRPAQAGSATGSSAINGTSIKAQRHGGASQASVGGMTGSTAKGAAAVSGTEMKSTP
jgi:hypothetical protein